MEPMQVDNSQNKSYDTIPYMLINLGNVDTIYIGKNTLVAYIKDEEADCEYFEVNATIEDVQCIIWKPSMNAKWLLLM